MPPSRQRPCERSAPLLLLPIKLAALRTPTTPTPTRETYAAGAAPAAGASESGNIDAPKTARGRETSAALKTAPVREVCAAATASSIKLAALRTPTTSTPTQNAHARRPRKTPTPPPPLLSPLLNLATSTPPRQRADERPMPPSRQRPCERSAPLLLLPMSNLLRSARQPRRGPRERLSLPLPLLPSSSLDLATSTPPRQRADGRPAPPSRQRPCKRPAPSLLLPTPSSLRFARHPRQHPHKRPRRRYRSCHPRL